MYIFYCIIFGVAFIFYFLLKSFNPIIRVGIPIAIIIISSLLLFFAVKKAVQLDAQGAGKPWTTEDYDKLIQYYSKENEDDDKNNDTEKK